MSPDTIQAGGVGEASEPRSTPYQGDRFSVHYSPSRVVSTIFNVEATARPPEDLLLGMEVTFENGAYSVRAVEVDVIVEEETPQEAYHSLLETVKDWLEYLDEENPDLAPDLEPQRRYTRLLRYEPYTWFGHLIVVD
jgi:hypothetical protein